MNDRVMYIFFFGATASIWAMAYLHETLRFTSVFFLDVRQSVGFLGRVISSSQGLCLYTNTEKCTYTQTLNIHALSGIRTHNPGYRANEGSTCLRPLGYRDQRLSTLPHKYLKLFLFSPGH
jgi:hypothetical protein